MIPLEDKLRAAIHATAEEIPADPPPLRLGSPALSPRRRPWFRPGASRLGEGRFRPGRRGWNTWLAPLAAAVLVIAVVLGSLAVTRSESGTAAPATTAGLAGVPPYYVALITLAAKPDQPVRTAAQVRSTATGAVLATIAAPKPNVAFNEITAAADDRTFVLTAQGEPYNSAPHLFVLHIDPKAHSVRVSLQALPASFVLAGDSLMDMALSPDGTSLAVESTSVFGTRLPVFKLTVFNLVTETRRMWSFEMSSGMTTGIHYVVGILDGLSWTADGQHVAFTGPGASAGSFALRVLDIRDPGPNALAASKPVPSAAVAKAAGGWMGAIITPDGRTVVFATTLTTRDGRDYKTRQELLKVSVATGQVTATLGPPKSLAVKALGGEQILYTNATGSVLVVGYAQLGTSAGILHGDTYTPIPWTASTVTAAW